MQLGSKHLSSSTGQARCCRRIPFQTCNQHAASALQPARRSPAVRAGRKWFALPRSRWSSKTCSKHLMWNMFALQARTWSPSRWWVRVQVAVGCGSNLFNWDALSAGLMRFHWGWAAYCWPFKVVSNITATSITGQLLWKPTYAAEETGTVAESWCW